MSKIFRLLFVLLLWQTVFSQNILSESDQSQKITDDSFLGKWCGRWDNIYSVCITINSVEDNSDALYQWIENKDEEFTQTNKKLIRINKNTLKIDNIYFALDETNLKQASVMGIFSIQSRVAVLSKQKR